VQLRTSQELASYWTDEYDWRGCEARLNALPRFETEIDGDDVRFIGEVAARGRAAADHHARLAGVAVELLETVGSRRTDRRVSPTAYTDFVKMLVSRSTRV
jgi:hypothetical protein